MTITPPTDGEARALGERTAQVASAFYVRVTGVAALKRFRVSMEKVLGLHSKFSALLHQRFLFSSRSRLPGKFNTRKTFHCVVCVNKEMDRFCFCLN
jgi:hypothetical protein